MFWNSIFEKINNVPFPHTVKSLQLRKLYNLSKIL